MTSQDIWISVSEPSGFRRLRLRHQHSKNKTAPASAPAPAPGEPRGGGPWIRTFLARIRICKYVDSDQGVFIYSLFLVVLSAWFSALWFAGGRGRGRSRNFVCFSLTSASASAEKAGSGSEALL